MRPRSEHEHKLNPQNEIFAEVTGRAAVSRDTGSSVLEG